MSGVARYSIASFVAAFVLRLGVARKGDRGRQQTGEGKACKHGERTKDRTAGLRPQPCRIVSSLCQVDVLLYAASPS